MRFETPHLREARLDQPIRGRRVRVMNLQGRIAAERGSGPDAQKRRGAGGRERQQGQTAGGGGNGDEAAASDEHH